MSSSQRSSSYTRFDHSWRLWKRSFKSIGRIPAADAHYGGVEAFFVLLVVIGLGLVAGSTTTIAGVGGGVVLTLALSPILGPHVALAVTALPLVLGNAHRLLAFRAHVDRRIVGA